MSATFCWWCQRKLRAPFYRTVKTMDDGQEVRVHARCEQDTKDFFTVTTAQPSGILESGNER